MTKYFCFLIVLLLVCTAKSQTKTNFNFIETSFNEKISKIKKVQYQVRIVINFPSGDIWDHTGFAVLEKNPSDSIFGFSFYGYKNEMNQASIYKDGMGFQIFHDQKNYREEKASEGFLGSVGGQMIYKDFFKLEKTFSKTDIITTDSSFIITFYYKDDPQENVTEIKRILELNKNTYLPIQVTNTAKVYGANTANSYKFYNLKINENIDKSIDEYLEQLKNLEPEKVRDPSPDLLINAPMPPLKLANLMRENDIIDIKAGKIILLDFWESWCSPCIKSLSEVEKLKKKYTKQLTVFGILTQDKEGAKKIINIKGVSFTNLIGSKNTHEQFNINSYPTYYLINQNGIIIKKYYGFSGDIEKDIVELMKNKN